MLENNITENKVNKTLEFSLNVVDSREEKS